MRLLVEKDESMLAACDRHADWLRRYVQEDDAVQVVDTARVAERFGEDALREISTQFTPFTFGEDDLADLA